MTESNARSLFPHEKLDVWQQARTLAKQVYKGTACFPRMDLNPDLMRSGSRRGKYSKAEMLVVWLAVEEAGYSCTEGCQAP
jgi:hypothetical protein